MFKLIAMTAGILLSWALYAKATAARDLLCPPNNVNRPLTSCFAT
jgi:hypothetical protein